jgi:UDP-glucose 4-epimerase
MPGQVEHCPHLEKQETEHGSVFVKNREKDDAAMKVLITGATGKVGSRLAKRLAQRGDQVRALVRDPTRAADLREARIDLAEGDLLKVDSLAAAVGGVDAVVHCAAFFRGATPEPVDAPEMTSARRLIEAI